MGNMNLLIVEDEPKMLALLRDGLVTEGHFVTLAATGTEGLSLAADFRFDVVILDRMLPSMDGCEIARRLRTSGNEVPILMLTARDAVNDVVSGLDAGIDDYLTKPFSFAVLSARLRALKRRPPQLASSILRFHEFELDIDSSTVHTNGRKIELTRTELRILEQMMRHPDRVHRRASLIERVWGYDCTVEDNTLDVFISQLRNKLDDGSGHRLIQTVRGLGYRLTSAAR